MNKSMLLAVATLASSVMLFGFAEEKPVPAKMVNGVQTVTVTVANGKYSPSVISAVKGKPLAITFRGGKNMGCGSEIVFKSLKMKNTVKEGKTVVFKFTPKKAGEIEFACSMHMYVGKAIIK